MTHINTTHLEFLEESKQVFLENPKQVTHIDEVEGLIALCYRYGNGEIPSISIYELGSHIAFFDNIVREGESNGIL